MGRPIIYMRPSYGNSVYLPIFLKIGLKETKQLSLKVDGIHISDMQNYNSREKHTKKSIDLAI